MQWIVTECSLTVMEQNSIHPEKEVDQEPTEPQASPGDHKGPISYSDQSSERTLESVVAVEGTIQSGNLHDTVHIPGPTAEIRTYRWRWIVLLLYSLNNAFVNIIWIPFAPIADVITCYYDVSLFWVNALSQVFMLSYVVLLFIVVWMLDKYGLKVCFAIAACCGAAGAALKLAGTGETSFYDHSITMLACTIQLVSICTALD